MIEVRKALSISAWDVFYNNIFIERFDYRREANREKQRLIKMLS